MSNMMRALVKARAEPGIWMQEVPIPEIGPNDVLIKVKKTAICGTDVHIYNWDQWAQNTVPMPMVTGHEFVGTVADFGSAVTSTRSGSASRAKAISSAAIAATAAPAGGICAATRWA